MSDLGDELHRARKVWKIGKTCPCKSFGRGQVHKSGAAQITELSNEDLTRNESNGITASKEGSNDVTVKTEASLISSMNQTACTGDSESSLEDDVNLMCDESLGMDSPADHEQEWLTEEKRRNLFTKKAGFGLVETKPQSNKKLSSGLSLLMDYNSSTDASPCESPVKDVKPTTGMFNFSLGGDRGRFGGLHLLVLACERNREELPVSHSVGLDAESKKEAEKPKPEPQKKQGSKEIRNGDYIEFFVFICLKSFS